MASNMLYVVCVLFVVYAVQTAKITGTIKKNNVELPSEIELSEHINGDNLGEILNLTLNRLVSGKILRTLTLSNFRSISVLHINNISLRRVPSFDKTSVRYIYITGNQIRNVPSNAFNGPHPSRIFLGNNGIRTMAVGSVNKGVEELSLRANKLAEFSQSWFKDPSGVSGLDLSGNQIEHIHDHTFDQMTALFTLDLSHNQISSIGSEVFISQLKYLRLQFNNIAELTMDMFVGRNESMTTLLLHHNKLSFIAEALLLNLKPTHISLDGNPWQCRCLQHIEQWIRELNITRHYLRGRLGEPVCVVPLSFDNVCVTAVNKELQQTYAKGQSPVQGCLATPNNPCSNAGLT